MNEKKRILIVTSGNLARNPRPAKEAATLARGGYEVSVLFPSEGPVWDAADREAARAGGYAVQPLTITPLPGARFLRRLDRWMAVRALALGWERSAALGPARALARVASAQAFHLAIVHNELGFWCGRRLLATGRPFAADFEDWYSEDLLPSDRRHRPLRLLRALESMMLHQAAFTTTPSKALSEMLHVRYGGRPSEVITNSFPLQPDPRRRDAGEPVRCLWFSQTIGPGRGLEAFLRSWAQLPAPPTVTLVGDARPGFPEQLRATLPPHALDQLRFEKPVAARDLPSLVARHDVGLALEEGKIPNRDGAATNKLLQYLNAGLAVIATPTAGQREVLAEAPDAGVFFDPSRPDDGAWRELLAGGDRLRRAQQAARHAAEIRFSWEKEEPRLLHLVAQALATR
ncbi:MAG TPA: glycosyltransferase [Candidatus Didemnitutus sp.]|nr:glycosyltransferase [Candidatus Didemnitutus sp.]